MLLLHTFQALQQRGVKRVGLFVDAKNKTGATRLYQRVGIHVSKRSSTTKSSCGQDGNWQSWTNGRMLDQ